MYAGSGGADAGAGAGHHGHGHHGGGGGGHSAALSSAAAEAGDLDALVFEFGSARCKLGYAGEDFPRVYEAPVPPTRPPDHAAPDWDGDSRAARADAMAAARMELEPERVAQWLFDAAASRLRARVGDHPLLFVERPFALPAAVADDPAPTTGDGPRSPATGGSTVDATTAGRAPAKKRDVRARERLVEVLMEELGTPAVFLAKAPVLTCYANARTSGLVVDLGATYSSATTVHDGFALAYPKTQVALFGGHDLDAFLRAKLAPQLAQQTSTGSIPPAPTVKFEHWWSYAIEAKESGLCRAADGSFDEEQNAQLPRIHYELPDKTLVTLGTERFSTAEQYFRPPPVAIDNASGGASPLAVGTGLAGPGFNLAELVADAGARSTEAELRKELFQNVVLTGGGSSFENFPARLEREVAAASAGAFAGAAWRVKVVAAHAQERKVGAFLGGSILASLGSFHEMWLSKAEYAEHGAALVHKKCP